MKMLLKFTLIGIVGLVILSVVAFYIDYYYYSWTSYANPFGCRYKMIKVKRDSSNRNNSILEQNYDLLKIGNAVKLDNKYHDVYFNAHRLSVSRNFDNIIYSISFGYHTTSTGNYFDVNFSNGNNTPELDKTTPDYYILQNIEKMIDEMPLNSEQKEELKSKVTVSCMTDWRTISF
jgi:hypothetical protein